MDYMHTRTCFRAFRTYGIYVHTRSCVECVNYIAEIAVRYYYVKCNTIVTCTHVHAYLHT
jgi:hypothetical protein